MQFYQQGWRFLPGLITIMLVAGLAKLEFFKPYEQIAYRFAFQLRGEQTWSQDIVVIAIDDESIERLGRFPWKRERYAQLLATLEIAKPKIIAFNILFSEAASDDDLFANAMYRSGRVILAEAWDATGESLSLPQVLQASALATGHIQQTEQDSDGLVRSIQPRNLSLRALSWVVVTQVDPTFESQYQNNLERPMWINWPGSAQGIRTYSFSDVVANRVDPEVFEQKIVLVGVSATGLDAFRTPFDSEMPTSSLTLHAAVIDNLLLNRHLHPLHGLWIWVGMLLATLGLSSFLSLMRSRQQLLVIFTLSICWVGLFSGLFFINYWLPLAAPLMLIGILGITSVIYQNLRESHFLQRHIHRLWQTHQADLVLPSIERMALSPSKTLSSIGLMSPSLQRLTLLAEFFGRSQSTQAAIARNLSLGLLATDAEGIVWFCNPVACEWLDIKLGDSLINQLIPIWLSAEQWTNDMAALKGDKTCIQHEVYQDNRWFELTLEQLIYPMIYLPNADPLLKTGWIVLLEDITRRKQIETQLRDHNQILENQVRHRTAELEATNADLQREINSRRQAQEQLTYRAFHDELTGLPNRNQFIYQLKKALEDAKHNSEYRFSVLFLDFNRFKLINDSFGHLVGDQLLKAFANRLQSSLRPSDWIARFGGDEFMLLLHQIEGHETAISIANRIVEHLATPFYIGNQKIFISTSIGIVIADHAYEQADDILRDADTAMYQAKQQGLPFEIFERGMHLAVKTSLQIETELRLAIDQGDLEVYYQPIVNLQSCQPIGFEALLRWHHPERGLIMPNKFIPVAEETGLILNIGSWILQQACQQLKNWQDQHLVSSQTLISINLSVKQFNQPNLIDQIEDLLVATKLPSHCLKLEITESTIIDNPVAAAQLLQQLCDRNIKVSIDDFGTGYSSLSYLQKLPVNILKIHQSFIHDLTQDTRSLGIIEAVIRLAKTLDLQVISEGIETSEQLTQLQSLGCDFGQGFLFARPGNNRQLEAWLQSFGVKTG